MHTNYMTFNVKNSSKNLKNRHFGYFLTQILSKFQDKIPNQGT